MSRMNADETLPRMTWHARPDMSCERVSKAWRDFTGLTHEAALGQGVHPEDLARWLDACLRAYDERRPFEIEYRLRRHDGEYRWVLERATPCYSEQGVFLGYAGVCVDIEDEKRPQPPVRRHDGEPLLAGVKVLVVDADRGARDRLMRVLGGAGADARAVATTAEALQTLGAWHPDVLLSGEGDSLLPALRSLAA